MTNSRQLEKTIKHIQKIHAEIRADIPDIKMLGTTPEEIEIIEEAQAICWLKVLELKPGAYEVADRYIRKTIVLVSIMIHSKHINEQGEFTSKQSNSNAN